MHIIFRTRLVGAIAWSVWCCIALTGCGGIPKPTPSPDRVSGTLAPPASQPATAAEWTDLSIKLDNARAERDRLAADLAARASNEAKIIDGTRWLGLAMIPGGIVVAIFVGRKLGIAIALAGAASLFLGVALGRIAPWVEWAAAGAVVVLFLYGLGSAGMSLYWRWVTNKQAAKLLSSAAGIERSVRRDDMQLDVAQSMLAAAAAQTAAAAALKHVGTPGYDPTRTDPSSKAVKLITGEQA